MSIIGKEAREEWEREVITGGWLLVSGLGFGFGRGRPGRSEP